MSIPDITAYPRQVGAQNAQADIANKDRRQRLLETMLSTFVSPLIQAGTQIGTEYATDYTPTKEASRGYMGALTDQSKATTANTRFDLEQGKEALRAKADAERLAKVAASMAAGEPPQAAGAPVPVQSAPSPLAIRDALTGAKPLPSPTASPSLRAPMPARLGAQSVDAPPPVPQSRFTPERIRQMGGNLNASDEEIARIQAQIDAAHAAAVRKAEMESYEAANRRIKASSTMRQSYMTKGGGKWGATSRVQGNPYEINLDASGPNAHRDILKQGALQLPAAAPGAGGVGGGAGGHGIFTDELGKPIPLRRLLARTSDPTIRAALVAVDAGKATPEQQRVADAYQLQYGGRLVRRAQPSTEDRQIAGLDMAAFRSADTTTRGIMLRTLDAQIDEAKSRNDFNRTQLLENQKLIARDILNARQAERQPEPGPTFIHKEGGVMGPEDTAVVRGPRKLGTVRSPLPSVMSPDAPPLPEPAAAAPSHYQTAVLHGYTGPNNQESIANWFDTLPPRMKAAVKAALK